MSADDPRAASDAQLVVAIGRFHQAALAEVYRRHAGATFGLALRILSSRVLAEDVVQEVLLSIHKNRHTYDPSLPFGPWMGTIAKRRIMDWLRKHYRSVAQEVLVDEYPETFLTDGANAVEEDALAFDDLDQLRQALDRLPSGQRQAVELLKLKEMSLKEASEVSGMSIAALKVAMHRALKSLRADMAPETQARESEAES